MKIGERRVSKGCDCHWNSSSELQIYPLLRGFRVGKGQLNERSELGEGDFECGHGCCAWHANRRCQKHPDWCGGKQQHRCPVIDDLAGAHASSSPVYSSIAVVMHTHRLTATWRARALALDDALRQQDRYSMHRLLWVDDDGDCAARLKAARPIISDCVNDEEIKAAMLSPDKTGWRNAQTGHIEAREYKKIRACWQGAAGSVPPAHHPRS